MINWKEIEPKTIELRKDLLATLTAVQKESGAENIPEASRSIPLAQELLAKPSYDLVICGEVKKGKSTFINALIGQELLPTGVKETTSQVFRISNSEKESFALVFTDGTSEVISQSELTRHGSQVDADRMGEPVFKNRQLDYIQINIPVAFLPQEINMVDTPGLGALYKSHELITKRYIQNAAAVVFIFDPSQPMVQQEKAFLEKVFAVTPYVMFVMTKIDCHDQAHWINQISRCETLLKEAFERSCYTMPKVFPIASLTLFDAAQEDDADARDELIEFSYFRDLQAELLRLMYQTVGLSRTQFAYDEALKQKQRTLASIDEQLKMIESTTKEEQESIREEKVKRKTVFEQTWGPASTKRKEVMQEVQLILGSVHNRASQLSATTGSIYKKYYAQIEELSNAGEITSFSMRVTEKILNEVSSEWQSIANNAQQDIMIALSSLKTQMEQVTNPASFNATGSFGVVALSGSEKFQSYKAKYFDAAVTSGIGVSLLSLAGVAVAPIAPIIFIGVLIYGYFAGGKGVEQREVEKNKAILKSGLSNLMHEINAQLFHVPLTGEHMTLVQKFTADLASSVEKAMAAMYEAEKSGFDNDLKRLDEQAKLGSEQKKKELVRINEQRKQWFNIAGQLEGEERLLNQIREALSV